MKSEAEQASDQLHIEIARRLTELNQRYLTNRRMVVDVLASADRPLSVPEIAELLPEPVPISTIYRNLTILSEAGAVHRLVAVDDTGRFELDEELSGHHHHHLICVECGRVSDVSPSQRLERALSEAAEIVSEDTDFDIVDHRLDLLGYCENCRRA